MTKDLTKGSPMKLIISFAVPLLFGFLFQQFYNLVDTMIVGRFLGVDDLAAVGSTGSINFLVIGFCMGVCNGFAIPVSHKFGAGDYVGMRKYVANCAWLGLVFSVVMTVVTAILCRNILVWMKTPANIIDGAYDYIFIIFIGIPTVYLYNIVAGVIRATGDSKTPVVFLVLSSIINIVLDLYFIISLHMGVAGVALATVISQCISAGLVLLCLMHAEGPYRVDLRRLRIRRAKLLQIMRIGLPAGVQGAIFSISNVLIQSSINSFGSVAMAGNSAASNLEGFIYTSMNAVYQTSLNFTSQNLGAGKRSRLMPILLRCLGVVFAVGALLGLIFYLLRYPLLGVYTSDPEVVSFGILRLELICSTYFLCGMMEVCCGSLRGLGYSVLPTVVSLTGACGLRVVWIFTVFAIDRSLWTLYLSYPVSWGLTALAHFICFLVVLKRQGGTKDVPPQTAAAK